MQSSQNIPKWYKDPYRTVLIGEEIGRGRYGTIYKSKWKCSSKRTDVEIVAIKIKEKSAKDVNKGRGKEEIELHQILKHPSIVELKDAWSDANNYYIVLEFCCNGTLEDYWMMHELNEPKVHYIMEQVVDGLKYLHSMKIIHRDLSLRNILVTKCYTTNYLKVKISDFGSSVQLCEPDETKQTFVGTPKFMSPEIVTGNSYCFKSDIWSLGIIFYALLFRKYPFEGASATVIFSKLILEDLDIPHTASFEAKELLCLLLNKNSEERPNIYYVSEHKFFKKYVSTTNVNRSRNNCLIPCCSNDSGNGSVSGLLLSKGSQMSNSISDNLEKVGFSRNCTVPLRESRNLDAVESMLKNVNLEKSASCANLKDKLCSSPSLANFTAIHRNEHSSFKNKINKVMSNSNPNLIHSENNLCFHFSKRSSPSLSNFSQKEDRKFFIFNTDRLPFCRADNNLCVYYINCKGQAIAERYEMKGGKKYITRVITVSPKGDGIQVFEPGNKEYLVGDFPVKVPEGEGKLYSVLNLPDKYWKKYLNIKKFVDFKKSKTAKVTVFGEKAKCEMMENLPNPDFLLTFYGGLKFLKVGSDMFVIDKNNVKSPVAIESLSVDVISEYDKMINLCQNFDDCLSVFASSNGLDERLVFPAKLGKKPESIQSTDECEIGGRINDQQSCCNAISNSIHATCSLQNKHFEKNKLSPVKMQIKDENMIVEFDDGLLLLSPLNSEGSKVKVFNSEGIRIVSWKSDSFLSDRVLYGLKLAFKKYYEDMGDIT